MDQLPLTFNVTMSLKDLCDLGLLLEADNTDDKWKWLFEELANQLEEQIEI